MCIDGKHGCESEKELGGQDWAARAGRAAKVVVKDLSGLWVGVDFRVPEIHPVAHHPAADAVNDGHRPVLGD